MVNVGFIDYYLNHSHSDAFKKHLEEIGNLHVAGAWAKIDKPGGQTNQDWCDTNSVRLLPSVEALIDECDALMVLSPDNVEMHEELCQKPLRSGKPVFVDKTFAPDGTVAERLFALADAHKTPVFSASALRFAEELDAVPTANIDSVSSRGRGVYDIYGVHVVEPVIRLMGSEVRRVLFSGTDHTPGLLIEFTDGRMAVTHHFGGWHTFDITVGYTEGEPVLIRDASRFYENLMAQTAQFFETKIPPVPAQDTIAVMRVLAAGRKAMESKGAWVAV